MYDTPVASIRFGSCGLAVFYIHTDHLNTPRRITKRSTNEIVWRWDSDAFGMTMANENPSGLGTFAFNLRFPGQYFDSETGLHYNYYRDYDPSTGRYVESDPIGLEAGVNTYAYVDSDPISFEDEFGLQRVPGRSGRGRGRWFEEEEYGRRLLEPYLGNGQPLYRYSTESPTQCGICVDVYFIARVPGSTRSTHRRSANQQFYDYLMNPAAPYTMGGMRSGELMSQMRNRNGQLRNPSGFEWHHPLNRPNEVWLMRTCDHRDPSVQLLLHTLPGGGGGYQQYLGGNQ
jgi:RHS repeat-associated protein